MINLQVSTQSQNMPLSILKKKMTLSEDYLKEDKYLTSEISTSFVSTYLKPESDLSFDKTLKEEKENTQPELDLSFQYFYAVFRLFNKFYTFRRPLEVTKFLIDNISLTPLLLEARKKAIEYFPSAKLVLEVLIDREDINEKKELVIFIRTNLSPKEALDKLEALYRDWWLDVPLEFDKVNINLELL